MISMFDIATMFYNIWTFDVGCLSKNCNFYSLFQDVSLLANYAKPPTVLVSPKHISLGGNVNPKYNAISAWIEVCVSVGWRCQINGWGYQKNLPFLRNGHDSLGSSHTFFTETLVWAIRILRSIPLSCDYILLCFRSENLVIAFAYKFINPKCLISPWW